MAFIYRIVAVKLQAFDVMAHTLLNIDQDKHIVITAGLVTTYPQLLHC